MSRVTRILDRARLILADKDSTRWSDGDLLSLFNEGLSSFVLAAETLKLRKYIIIEDNITHYDMSPYSTEIKRVDYLSSVLTAKTYEEMDKSSLTWREDTGDIPQYVIFNKQKANNFKIYPIVQGGYANIVTANSPYGTLIDVSVTDDLLQAPVSEDIEIDISKYLLIYYIGKPRDITIDTLDTDIDLDSMYDLAMISYIAGQTLLFDEDSLSRELGTSQLSTYSSYVMEATSNESEHNNSFIEYITEYRSF